MVVKRRPCGAKLTGRDFASPRVVRPEGAVEWTVWRACCRRGCGRLQLYRHGGWRRVYSGMECARQESHTPDVEAALRRPERRELDDERVALE